VTFTYVGFSSCLLTTTARWWSSISARREKYLFVWVLLSRSIRTLISPVEVAAAAAAAVAAVAPFQVGLCNNTLASLLPSVFTIVICHVTWVHAAFHWLSGAACTRTTGFYINASCARQKNIVVYSLSTDCCSIARLVMKNVGLLKRRIAVTPKVTKATTEIKGRP